MNRSEQYLPNWLVSLAAVVAFVCGCATGSNADDDLDEGGRIVPSQPGSGGWGSGGGGDRPVVMGQMVNQVDPRPKKRPPQAPPRKPPSGGTPPPPPAR